MINNEHHPAKPLLQSFHSCLGLGHHTGVTQIQLKSCGPYNYQLS